MDDENGTLTNVILRTVFAGIVLKRAVILKNYYMPNGLTSLIHKKNLPNFQGCWGKVKKNLRTILLKKFTERSSKLEKGYSQVLVKQTVS